MIPYHRPFVKYNGSYMLSNGDKVRELEKAIKELYDVDYVIACSSCTQGLMLAISLIKGWYHIPAFTWISVKYALNLMKQSYSYLDISKTTWHINDFNVPCSIPNHTFGSVYESATERVIYDGAHALGSKIKEFGLATIFSLAPTKLVTSCEGGIIVTNDKERYDYLKELRDRVSRMSEPNAAYGLETLKSLDEVLAWKKKLFNYYSHHLPGIFQQIPHNSNYNTIGFLTDLKIPPHIEYKKYYEPLDFSLPNTKFVYNHIVCLPSWYGVDYEKVVDDILSYNEALKSGRVKSYVSEM